MKPNVNAAGEMLWSDLGECTSNVIGGPLPSGVGLRIRNEERRQKRCEFFRSWRYGGEEALASSNSENE